METMGRETGFFGDNIGSRIRVWFGIKTWLVEIRTRFDAGIIDRVVFRGDKRGELGIIEFERLGKRKLDRRGNA